MLYITIYLILIPLKIYDIGVANTKIGEILYLKVMYQICYCYIGYKFFSQLANGELRSFVSSGQAIYVHQEDTIF